MSNRNSGDGRRSASTRHRPARPAGLVGASAFAMCMFWNDLAVQDGVQNMPGGAPGLPTSGEDGIESGPYSEPAVANVNARSWGAFNSGGKGNMAAPHWVQNGDDVSVSFSITFRTDASERRERLYQVNARLRGLGLRPQPVGRRPRLDDLKLGAYDLLAKARRTLRPPHEP